MRKLAASLVTAGIFLTGCSASAEQAPRSPVHPLSAEELAVMPQVCDIRVIGAVTLDIVQQMGLLHGNPGIREQVVGTLTANGTASPDIYQQGVAGWEESMINGETNGLIARELLLALDLGPRQFSIYEAEGLSPGDLVLRSGNLVDCAAVV